MTNVAAHNLGDQPDAGIKVHRDERLGANYV